ncbi:hypothetical protein CNYM01_00110 [Colletotrichum nymphaeae SA-01]|uniref:Infection structure specific protein n=1 Tax=Colletotrichum nymphaeae SA-01 TaxID=1460502 RepID=A0A135UJQ9_9PEZI|nr:hypothetical protein CNYM01_00110 [Colletotrichum nymphaeae SA-01]
MQSKLLLAAAAATGAMAFEMSGTLPRVLRRAGNDALEARDETACASVWMAHSTIVDDFPTEPTALATETNLDIPQITDPCVFPSITGQAGQIITSYSSALQSWQDVHITEIRDIYSACSDVPEVAHNFAMPKTNASESSPAAGRVASFNVDHTSLAGRCSCAYLIVASPTIMLSRMTDFTPFKTPPVSWGVRPTLPTIDAKSPNQKSSDEATTPSKARVPS